MERGGTFRSVLARRTSTKLAGESLECVLTPGRFGHRVVLVDVFDVEQGRLARLVDPQRDDGAEMIGELEVRGVGALGPGFAERRGEGAEFVGGPFFGLASLFLDAFAQRAEKRFAVPFKLSAGVGRFVLEVDFFVLDGHFGASGRKDLDRGPAAETGKRGEDEKDVPEEGARDQPSPGGLGYRRQIGHAPLHIRESSSCRLNRTARLAGGERVRQPRALRLSIAARPRPAPAVPSHEESPRQHQCGQERGDGPRTVAE
jgi:hypothetical protein